MIWGIFTEDKFKDNDSELLARYHDYEIDDDCGTLAVYN